MKQKEIRELYRKYLKRNQKIRIKYKQLQKNVKALQEKCSHPDKGGVTCGDCGYEFRGEND